MARYCIIVDFSVAPGAMDRFLPHVLANAALSLRDEPGCRVFDVLRPANDAGRVTLYEIYDDRAAFDAHLKTPHLAVFEGATSGMVARKVVTEMVLQE